jgi:hypothetical protein
VVKIIASTIGVAALMCSASAVTLSKNDEAARNAVVQWLELVDAGRFEEAASQASQEVRGFEQWINHLKTQRASLGKMTTRRFFNIKHQPTFPGGFQVRKYYIVRFKTSFEHKPAATEEIALTRIGCCWEIFEYQISDK